MEFFVRGPVQLKWMGVYSGLLVWMILGLGLFILSISSSSFSWSLSHTWTTTLGVVSVAACSSYFSPRERDGPQGNWGSSKGATKPGHMEKHLGPDCQASGHFQRELRDTARHTLDGHFSSSAAFGPGRCLYSQKRWTPCLSRTGETGCYCNCD